MSTRSVYSCSIISQNARPVKRILKYQLRNLDSDRGLRGFGGPCCHICRLTWLPLRRTTSNPARSRAWMSSAPERTGSLTNDDLQGVENDFAGNRSPFIRSSGKRNDSSAANNRSAPRSDSQGTAPWRTRPQPWLPAWAARTAGSCTPPARPHNRRRRHKSP